MYEEAVAHYLRAVDQIGSKKSEYTHFKKNLTEKEALIYSSIASCYKQTQQTKKEIEYCSKVIERAPYVSDSNVLAKSYLLRGYAYESIEKLNEAKEDMTRVRELQPTNQEASRALARLNKAIKDVGRVDLSDVDAKLAKIKEAGNQRYTEKNFKEAIKKFSEGIDLYLADPETFKTDKDVKLKVTQLYTNRSLAHHQLGDHNAAHRDADHVLNSLDQTNVKALMRRGFAAKMLGKYDESVRDF
jgi:tetratricopeptide (TPR) repeat protein